MRILNTVQFKVLPESLEHNKQKPVLESTHEINILAQEAGSSIHSIVKQSMNGSMGPKMMNTLSFCFSLYNN